jgi:hypothetical protein
MIEIDAPLSAIAGDSQRTEQWICACPFADKEMIDSCVVELGQKFSLEFGVAAVVRGSGQESDRWFVAHPAQLEREQLDVDFRAPGRRRG